MPRRLPRYRKVYKRKVKMMNEDFIRFMLAMHMFSLRSKDTGKLYVGLIRKIVKGNEKYLASLVVINDEPQQGRSVTVQSSYLTGYEGFDVKELEFAKTTSGWGKYESLPDEGFLLLMYLGDITDVEKAQEIIDGVLHQFLSVAHTTRKPPPGCNSFRNELSFSLAYVKKAVELINLHDSSEDDADDRLLASRVISGRRFELMLGRCALQALDVNDTLARAFDFSDAQAMDKTLRKYQMLPSCEHGPRSIPRCEAPRQ